MLASQSLDPRRKLVRSILRILWPGFKLSKYLNSARCVATVYKCAQTLS